MENEEERRDGDYADRHRDRDGVVIGPALLMVAATEQCFGLNLAYVE
jgi:hypothetical protein